MIVLVGATDELEVVTGTALANCLMHASWMNIDNTGVVTPGRLNLSVATATTSNIITAPAANNYRCVESIIVKNTNASAQTITIQHNDGTTVIPYWSGVLAANEYVIINKDEVITKYDAGGAPIGQSIISNSSIASIGPGFAADTYVTESRILIPSQRPRIGTVYECEFGISKTAAGTATPIMIIRYGTLGAIGDTALCSFALSVGTAATDSGIFKVRGMYRNVGAAAVMAGRLSLTSQPTTGFSTLLKGHSVISAAHNSTTPATYLGVSVNGGTGAVWTIDYVKAKLIDI